MKTKNMSCSYPIKQLAKASLFLAGVAMSTSVLAKTHSLLIAVDGLRGDGIENAHTPNLDNLIRGNWANGYNTAFAHYAQTMKDAAPNSGPNHVGIMTGVTSNKSGVSGNNDVAGGNYAAYPHYLTLLEQANPSLNTAYLVTWSTDMQITNSADVKIDADDATNTQNAVDIINGTFASSNWQHGTDVDALFLFLDDVDGAGHACCFAASDNGYINEINDVDSQIGRILAAIKNRPNFDSEDWQIVLTSDHGGRGSSHGIHAADNYTIPFLVSSKTAKQGYLAGVPHNYDAAPTVLAHHGLAVPKNMDGVVQGNLVRVVNDNGIKQDLKTYLPFDGNYLDASGNALHAQVGGGTPNLQAGGKFGQYVKLNDDQEYLTLGKPTELDFGTDTNFTLMTWFRVSGDQAGDPVIVGNKNWASGANRGTLLLANEGNGDDFGINLASSGADRKDIDPIDYSFNGWWLLVATFDRNGVATMYAGSPTGELNIIAGDIVNVGDINSELNWNIGQDGTGNYTYNLKADLDDFAVWRRALSLDEVRTIYNKGQGTELNTLLNNVQNRYLTQQSNIQVGQDVSLVITTEVNGETCGLEWDNNRFFNERNAKWDCTGNADPMTFTVTGITNDGNKLIADGYLVANGNKGAFEWDSSKHANERNAKFDENSSGDLISIWLLNDINQTRIVTEASGQTCGLEWDASKLSNERNAKWDCTPNMDTFRIELL
ncbi:alkaline phosphatase family protein [Pseudoalteromonas sp. T1lg24]|uniref:alkaline phosphatase family protein n=1 Tax=Pseudoalteromonas sp. T1lg24 TaxID=2077099 RepID=UPI000CF6EFFA|nr:alkaline phosphatase family protein [Pseudoalteromonas sp. T1lg24]